jgi:hypothetical protein
VHVQQPHTVDDHPVEGDSESPLTAATTLLL